MSGERRTEINFKAGIRKTGTSNGIVARLDMSIPIWIAVSSISRTLHYQARHIPIRSTDIRSLTHILGTTACRPMEVIVAWTNILPMVTMSTEKQESVSQFRTQLIPTVMGFSIREAVSV